MIEVGNVVSHRGHDFAVLQIHAGRARLRRAGEPFYSHWYPLEELGFVSKNWQSYLELLHEKAERDPDHGRDEDGNF